jgi:hypothetical protein
MDTAQHNRVVINQSLSHFDESTWHIAEAIRCACVFVRDWIGVEWLPFEEINFVCGVTKEVRTVLLKLKCQGKPWMRSGEPRASRMLAECNRKKKETRGDSFYSAKRVKRKRRWFGCEGEGGEEFTRNEN